MIKLISVEPAKKSEAFDYIFTFEETKRLLWWKKTETWSVIGSGTVWYWYPQFQRCSTSMETWMSGIYKREMYKRNS